MNILIKIEFRIKILFQFLKHLKYLLLYRNRVFYSQRVKSISSYNLYLDNSSSKIIFKSNIQLKENCKFLSFSNGSLTINEGVFFNNNCSVNCLHSIDIGKNTIFGESVKIYDHNHKYDDSSILIKEQGFNTAPIKIGKNCWIGSNVVILKGVNIGDNSIIGTGCVIYKNIPANSIVKSLSNLDVKIIDKNYL